MFFYHYTALENLEAIKAEGITKGEVPLTRLNVINGVWLTTDMEPAGHGLSSGDETISGANLRRLKAQGIIAAHIPDDAVIQIPNKRAVRLKVRMKSSDRSLEYWMKWGRKHLDQEWFDTLNHAGGGTKKAKTWYVSFRTITPDEIVTIDILDDSTA